jgi:hypothetical protein
MLIMHVPCPAHSLSISVFVAVLELLALERLSLSVGLQVHVSTDPSAAWITRENLVPE